MNDLARQKLCEVVAKYGCCVCDDPKRLRALLADACPGQKREVHVLVGAAEARVAADLLNSSANLPWEVVSGPLVRRLAEDLAFAEKAARWAVEAWGLALGRIETPCGTTTPQTGPPIRSRWFVVLPLLAGCAMVFGIAFLIVFIGSATREVQPGKVARRLLEMHTSTQVFGVAYSPDGLQIASASGRFADEGSSVVTIWDAKAGRLERTLLGHRSEVYCVAFSPDGRRVASGGNDGTVRLWDVKTGEGKSLLWQQIGGAHHLGNVEAVAFSQNGKRLAGATALQDFEGRTLSGVVIVWDTDSGNEVFRLKGQTQIGSVAFSPDGRWIATAANYGDKVILWDAKTGQEQRNIVGHSGWSNSVAFSPDNSRLVSATNDMTLKVWDLQDGRELRTITTLSSAKCVVFHPNGKSVASGHNLDSKAVIIWDVFTGHEVGSISRQNEDHENMNSFAFSPDGRQVAVGQGSWGSSGKITVWSLE